MIARRPVGVGFGFGLILILVLAACAVRQPPTPLAGPAPLIEAGAPYDPAALPRFDPDTGEAVLPLRVLTWNVAGLPAPLKSGRAEALARIGEALAELRAAGAAPHIVLIQEGFMTEAVEAMAASAGYRHVARGPGRSDREGWRARRDPALGRPLYGRGEGLIAVYDGGLYVLSDFPLEGVDRLAFDDCAGFDCLAAKGAMIARVRPPGAPDAVAVLNTHLNSRRSSKVPVARAHLAHRLQIGALKRFADEAHAAAEPIIFGGDFNMRRSPERWDHAVTEADAAFARARCQAGAGCDASALPATEAAMTDTQDLQGFHDGAAIRIRPVRLAIIDDRESAHALSDHSAYLVEYELRWGGDGAPARAGFADLLAANGREMRTASLEGAAVR